MRIVLTCSECGYQEWGSAEGTLMNKIKMWNHASEMHPESVWQVIERSVPKHSFSDLIHQNA